MTNISEKNIDFVSRRTIIDKINAEFSKFDPDYVRKKRLWQAKLNVLSQRLLDLQKRSNPMFRSDQIEIEARWLVNYRSEWPLVEKRLDDLWLSLDDTESADQRNQIQDSDGAVARGSIEWIFKLDPTIDYIQQKGIELEHIQPLTFLAPLLDPKEFLATVHRLQISDVARTGRNYRSELGSIESAMSQLLFKDGELSKFVTDRRLWPDHSKDQIIEKVEALKASYLDFLRQVQHSRAGYWGPWYVIEDGLESMQDLSFAFHQVSYLKGAVDRWRNIIETTLAIKDQIYPYGWRPSEGSDFSNHHNYDVLTIFKRGWPLVDPNTQRRMADAIFEIFDWSLTKSLVREPTCGFRTVGDEDNTIDPYYFGVRFLKLAGFWNSADRFWWNSELNWKADWPDPMQVARCLLDAVRQLRDPSETAQAVIEMLQNILTEMPMV